MKDINNPILNGYSQSGNFKDMQMDPSSYDLDTFVTSKPSPYEENPEQYSNRLEDMSDELIEISAKINSDDFILIDGKIQDYSILKHLDKRRIKYVFSSNDFYKNYRYNYIISSDNSKNYSDLLAREGTIVRKGFGIYKKSNLSSEKRKEKFIVEIYNPVQSGICPVSLKKSKNAFSYNLNNKIINFSSLNNKNLFIKNKDYFINDKSFIMCNAAVSMSEKHSGLQSYDKLNTDSGLLFVYDKPTNVSFHMGKVSFPIDIIFFDKNNFIKKICKDIRPGNLGIYSCADVKYVLEVNSGVSESLRFKIGKKIKIHKNKTGNVNADKAFKSFDQLKIESSAFDCFNYYNDFTQNFGNFDIYKKSNFEHLRKVSHYINLDKVLNKNNIYRELRKVNPKKLIIYSSEKKSFSDFLIDIYNYNKLTRNIECTSNLDDLKGSIEIFASSNIPDETILSAKHIIQSSELILESLKILMNNLNHNVNEYKKYNNPKVNKKSVSSLHNSNKRNLARINNILKRVLSIIEKCSAISDVGDFPDIIENLSLQSEQLSIASEEVFELVHLLDEEDFVSKIESKTLNCENISKDFEKSIERLLKFIKKDILDVGF